MPIWRDIDLSCRHCGKPLQAAWTQHYGAVGVIDGLHPIMYRHQDGTTECVIRRKPGAYDDWIGNRALKEAENALRGEGE